MSEKQYKYLVKLIVVMGIVTASLSMLTTSIMLSVYISKLDKSAQQMLTWSKKADLATDMINDMFKVQKIKEDYGRQGIKATEDNL